MEITKSTILLDYFGKQGQVLLPTVLGHGELHPSGCCSEAAISGCEESQAESPTLESGVFEREVALTLR